MARLEYAYPVKRAHGKVKKGSNTSYRGDFTYTMQNPRTEKDFSEHEKRYRKTFGELNKEASRINKDPNRMAEYQDWKEKGYRSRFRYILAELVRSTDVP